MSGLSIFGRQDLAVSIEPVHHEAFITVLPVFLKIETTLDQERSRVGVVTHAVAAHPRIAQRKRDDEDDYQECFVFVELEQSLLSLSNLE